MSFPLLRAVCFLSLGLLACGDDASPVDAGRRDGGADSSVAASRGDAGADAARTEPRGDAAAVDASTPDAATADASEPAADAGLCAAYAPAAPARTEVTVRLVNRTGKALFLGATTQGCGEVLLYSLSTDSGQQLVPALSACAFTCEAVQSGQCAACPPVCFPNPVRQLAPNGSFELSWAGSVFALESMPASCTPDSCGSGRSCYVERPAPAALRITSSAYPAAVCGGGACTACTPDASGSCVVMGADTVSGAPLSAQLSWQAGQSVAELVFQ